MWHFWRGLICALKARDVEVMVITPDGPYVPDLLGLGIPHRKVRLDRFMSPVNDLRFCLDLYRIFKAENVDLVCTITVKPNVYGAIVARLAGVKKLIGMVEGLGYGFDEGVGWKSILRAGLVRKLYWLAGRLCDRMGFANRDDYSMFVSLGLVPQHKAVQFKSMIGVNLREFSPGVSGRTRPNEEIAALKHDPDTVLVVMVVARVVWSKGVREFVQASQMAGAWSKKAQFVLVGPLDPGAYDAVDENYLVRMLSPTFRWSGFTSDIRSVWESADVAVLPSYYREGVPRSLLEAMAMAKPLVTTDNVGCREVVEEGKNGFLVQPRDSIALAAAIERLVSDDEQRRLFGQRSREKAVAEFDEQIIIKRLIRDLYQIEA
jgi:N,N'-diacetylbacillosaminyl-diphospho-undecaprenol alpha-1,3-N-acetylgalactosaminyltransferase